MTGRALGDVADFYGGSSLPSGEEFSDQLGGYLLLRVSDLNLPNNSTYITTGSQWTAKRGPNSATAPKNSLVIPKRGGAIGTNKKRILARDCILDPNLMAIHPHDQELDVRFLYHWFKTFDLLDIASGSAVPQLNKQDLRPLLLPMPSLDEQRRIAAVLDQVDELRAKRSRAISLLDDLAQAIFFDMFGDLVNNERSWPEGSVSSFVNGFEAGKSLAEGDDSSASQFRILKISAVTSGRFRACESKPAPAGYVPPASHIVRGRDLLFSRANTSELVGATAFVPDGTKNLLMPDKLWRFIWKDEKNPNPWFAHYLFKQPSMREVISRNASGSSGSMKNISKEKLLSIKLGIPPVELQCEFERRVLVVEDERGYAQSQASTLDELFDSLQARAFRGEL